MAFFDQISKRITDAGQVAAQHTRVLTDTTRLNMKIAENKKKMSQLLFEMGHDYYQKHRKDIDNEEQAYIDQVNVLFLEIINCQDEIERIKAAAVQERSPWLNTRKCPVCGSAVEQDSVFCTTCGIRLPEENHEFVETDKLEETAFRPRVCPVCGAEVEDHDLFCLSCGTELSNTI